MPTKLDRRLKVRGGNMHHTPVKNWRLDVEHGIPAKRYAGSFYIDPNTELPLYFDGTTTHPVITQAAGSGGEIPLGGTTGQILGKLSNADLAFSWIDPPADGADGADGLAGNDGADGAQGPVGPTGPQGEDGANGTNGTVGATGPKGDKGATGDTGPQGPIGNDGADGPQGPAGADSIVAGPQGIQGIQGPVGPTGADSNVAGPQGIQGPAGNDGADGATGPAGNDGADGAQGPVGPQGPEGPAGGGGGGSLDYASFYQGSGGITSITNVARQLNLSDTHVNSNSTKFQLISNSVIVTEAGDYRLSFNTYLNQSGTSRSEYSIWISKNGTEIVGSRAANYQRGYDSGQSSTVDLIVTLAANDFITLHAQRTDGAASTVYQDNNGTRLVIEEK